MSISWSPFTAISGGKSSRLSLRPYYLVSLMTQTLSPLDEYAFDDICCEAVQLRCWPLLTQADTSTPVPRRPLPVCIQCRLQTTPSLCQPRSSRRASLSSQQLLSAGFFCGRRCDMELVTRQYERPGHQQRLIQTFTGDVFIFSLLVYIAH